MKKNEKKCKNIWSIQKKAVLLHPLSRKRSFNAFEIEGCDLLEINKEKLRK